MITKELEMVDAKALLDGIYEKRWRPEDETQAVGLLARDVGAGTQLEGDAIERAKKALENIQGRYPDPLTRDEDKWAVDSRAAEAIHRELNLDASTAGNPKFWRWLAIAKFRKIIHWRHCSKGKDPNYRNF
jgi:hypothetical protein